MKLLIVSGTRAQPSGVKFRGYGTRLFLYQYLDLSIVASSFFHPNANSAGNDFFLCLSWLRERAAEEVSAVFSSWT